MAAQIITVAFHADTLYAIDRDDGIFVAIAPICRSLGISINKQRKRIQEDLILNEGGTVMVLPSVGGAQETLCLRLDLVNGWLFSIDHRRVREDVRAKVIAYQRECYRVLFEHFYSRAGGKVPVTEASAKEPISVRLRMISETREIYGVPAAAQLWFALGLPIVPAMMHGPAQLHLFTPKDDDEV